MVDDLCAVSLSGGYDDDGADDDNDDDNDD